MSNFNQQLEAVEKILMVLANSKLPLVDSYAVLITAIRALMDAQLNICRKQGYPPQYCEMELADTLNKIKKALTEIYKESIQDIQEVAG